MGSHRTAVEVASRFHEEQQYIERYVSFVRHHTTLWSGDIEKLQSVLQLYALPLLKFERSGPEEVLTKDEMEAVLRSSYEITPVLDAAIRECEDLARRHPKLRNVFEHDDSADVLALVGSVMSVMDHALTEQSLPAPGKKLLNIWIPCSTATSFQPRASSSKP